MNIAKVLTIAGSDCSGGAGIQADLKTIACHKAYGMSAITSLTAQNTCGVFGVKDCSPDFLKLQIDCVFGDIFPDAVKVGMVSNEKLIAVIAESFQHYKARNIVIDPVMISTSGCTLLNPLAINAMVTQLLPLADIITPNIHEAEALCNHKISNKQDMVKCGIAISKSINPCVLIKGGHLSDCCDDLLIYQEKEYWFVAPKLQNNNTHGTGCTLSSAIACNLAHGMSLPMAVEKAKKYVHGAIQSQLDLGKGNGPLNHTYLL